MKDAKGHGSNARGGASAATAPAYQGKPTWHGVMPNGQKVTNAAGNKIAYASPEAAVAGATHQAGVNSVGKAPDINSAIYNTARKMPGYTSKVTPLNADYSASGRMLRSTMSPLGAGMTKEDHKAAGDAHIQQAMAMNAQHRDLVDKAMSKLGMQSPGPLISGIVSDKFSEADKNKLRDLAHGASEHTSAAFAHYAASGMRLPTARARYQGLKG